MYAIRSYYDAIIEVEDLDGYLDEREVGLILIKDVGTT